MTQSYDDQALAQMRAEMLMRSETPQYDDGASQLGADPDFMHVGLFGRAPKPVKPVKPVDLSRRRAFGLPDAPMSMPATGESVNSMIPVPQSPQQPAPMPQPTAPEQPTPPQPSNPLGQLANKALNEPVSRRTVLQRAGSAAIQSALPTPSATDVAKEVISPLVEAAAPQATSAIAGIAPGITTALRNLLTGFIDDQLDNGIEGAPDQLRSYLDRTPDIDPELKSIVNSDLEKYKELEALDPDSEEMYDMEYELYNHFKPLISQMPGDEVLNSLAQTPEFYDYLNGGGMKKLVTQFRKQGATKENVLDFLDQYFPGFDATDPDALSLIDKVYSAPLKAKKSKD